MALGDQYRVQIGYDRLNEAAELNGAAGEHLWTILVQYGLTKEEAARASEGVDHFLDLPHLLAVTQIGCYICEQTYDRVATKKCRGHPIAYRSDGEPVYR